MNEDLEALEDLEIDLNTPDIEFSESPSENLIDIIVTFRYLNIFKEESIEAMKELAVRRLNGDPLDFESEIEKKLKDMPKLDPNLDIMSYLKEFK
jgi:hypothetical protein